MFLRVEKRLLEGMGKLSCESNTRPVFQMLNRRFLWVDITVKVHRKRLNEQDCGLKNKHCGPQKVKRREKRLEVLEEQSCCRTSVSHDRSNKLKRHSIIPKNMLCNICNCVRAKTTQWNTKVFPVCCRGCAKRGVKRGKYKKGK